MTSRRLWVILIILACLTPLGVWLPQRLRAGGAWGEWAPEELGKQVGAVPRGMARASDLWHAPLPGYAPKGQGSRSLLEQGMWYVVSALAGIAVCGAIIWLVGRWLAGKEQPHAT